MGKRRKTPGRKRVIGVQREPNGRAQRANEPDIAVLMQRARKAAVTRSHTMEMSPLGILAGHGLITEEMHGAAKGYRALHWQIFSGGPEMPLPFLAKLPSDQWSEDIDESLRRQNMPEKNEKKLRAEYECLHDRMTHDQQEIVHALAVFDEWPPIMENLDTEIVMHRMRWDDKIGLVHGRPPSQELRVAVKAIREAFEALMQTNKKVLAVSGHTIYSQ